MDHSFNVEIAKRYGIHAAVILKSIYFWITKNIANEKNYFDGNYWTYNSKKALSNLFPYMTARQIDYAMQKLINDGLIITGNYNKSKYDRTLWYAITKKGYSILQNCEMDSTNYANRIDDSVKPIPDINTDKDTVKYTDINNTIYEEFTQLWESYPRKIGKKRAFEAYKRAKKAGVTDDVISDGINRYRQYIESRKIAEKYIKQGSTWFNGECWNDEYDVSDRQLSADEEREYQEIWGG